MTPKQVLELAKKHKCVMVDLRITDWPGSWQHCSHPIETLTEETFEDGYGFDGDNHLGSTPQPNGWCDDWVVFNAERRLGQQFPRDHGAVSVTSCEVLLVGWDIVSRFCRGEHACVAEVVSEQENRYPGQRDDSGQYPPSPRP